MLKDQSFPENPTKLAIEKLPVEIWLKIWGFSGVSAYQLCQYAQVNRYFKMISDNHIEWKNICKSYKLPAENVNCKFLVSRVTMGRCLHCFNTVKQVADHESGEFRECYSCKRRGKMFRERLMNAEIKKLIKSKQIPISKLAINLHTFFESVNDYIEGRDRTLTIQIVVSGISECFERLSILNCWNGLSFLDQTLPRNCVLYGDDPLATYLFVTWKQRHIHLKNLRFQEIKSLIQSDCCHQFDKCAGIYVDHDIGDIALFKQHYNCNIESDRKSTLEIQLRKFGIELNDQDPVCAEFMKSGNVSQLNGTVSYVKAWNWASRTSIQYDQDRKSVLRPLDYESFHKCHMNANTLIITSWYCDFMCSKQRDFTLPRFQDTSNNDVPPSYFWKEIEINYNYFIINALDSLKIECHHKVPISEIWSLIDTLIGKNCSETIKYFLLIEELPEFVKNVDHYVLNQISVALRQVHNA